MTDARATRRLVLRAGLAAGSAIDAGAQARESGAAPDRGALPHLHHVGLNSVDPERAIAC